MLKCLTMLALLCVLPAQSYAAAAPKPPPRKPHHVVEKCSEEIERGIASWYGPGFEGAQTQNEEVFDPASLSAAHPSLPFGTVVKVTNMRNQKSVTVRVNDRGPFGDDRKVIDLARHAAEQLDMIHEGTMRVELRVVNGP